MNWLKDFFFCNTWKEFFVMLVVSSVGLVIFWALISATIILLG